MSNFSNRSKILSILCVGVGLGACAAHAGTPSVELKGHIYSIEIASDDATRTRGLMFRDSMEKDHGMLFLFEHPTVQTFWMKNTHIPLDILYFDENYKLVSVSQRTPPCRSEGMDCPVYPSAAAAQYVLELNSGEAERISVKPGDRLKVNR